jgi:acetyl esterase/lipase
VSALLVPLVLISILGILAGCSRPVMSFADVMALPQPPADARLAYADHPSGFGDLRLPPGAGPFPVVVLVHGGCWLAEYDLGYLSSLAAAITAEGYATWNIEYRRVGEDGGGWPGTFVDAAAAADHVRILARSYPLDTDRVVAIGHSAGGHLALWLAARQVLPPDDPLRGPDPIALAGVVSLAGIPDLAAYNAPQGCGSAVPGLLGGDPAAHPDRLQRASPITLLPLAVPRVLISGGRDAIVPAIHARNYAAAGGSDPISTIVVDSAGHFELVTPEGRAWRELREALRMLSAAKSEGVLPGN